MKCPRPTLVILMLVAAGLMAVAAFTWPIAMRPATWWNEVYGRRADGSHPLVPGEPHRGDDGNIYWTAGTPAVGPPLEGSPPQ